MNRTTFRPVAFTLRPIGRHVKGAGFFAVMRVTDRQMDRLAHKSISFAISDFDCGYLPALFMPCGLLVQPA